MDEVSDLPLFSGVPELVAKMVDPNLPDVPSRERVTAFLEAGGWLRATAGDGDFLWGRAPETAAVRVKRRFPAHGWRDAT